GDLLVVLGVGLEHQPHAQLLAARLQDVEQALAADADETVAAGADALALEMDFDVVPVVERIADFAGADGIGRLQVAHGGVGKHHAPAEGVVGAVAFDDHDLVGRVVQLHEQPEVQAGGTSAYADDIHGNLASVHARRKPARHAARPDISLSLYILGFNYIRERMGSQ